MSLSHYQRQELDKIKKLSKANSFSDSWKCPECVFGDMDGEDACEAEDEVECDTCGHKCALNEIVCVQGQIAALLEIIESLQKGSETKP